MTGITGLAVVGIPTHILMLVIHLGFYMGMTIDTREFKVIGCPVTIGTKGILMSP
jgi:hypothetical protein